VANRKPFQTEDHTDFATRSAFYYGVGERDRHELAYLAMGVAGEAGEFADVVKKIIREPEPEGHISAYEQRYAQLVDELGDLLWYVSNWMNVLGLTYEEVMALNALKLAERYPHNTGNFTYHQQQKLSDVREALAHGHGNQSIDPNG